MKLCSIFAGLAACVVAITPMSARAKPATRPAAPHAANWLGTVTRTAQEGYLLGNPAAKVHLVAYISYTCPHCAAFEAQAAGQLALGMIAPGKGSYEIRPYLRSPIDMVVSLLAECGSPAKFFGNTQLLLATQRDWMSPLGSLTEAQKARWESSDFGSSTRAIASDLGLYTLMARRGYDRVALDRCLTDKAHADRLARHTQDATDKDFVQGTPAFVLNDVPLTGTSTWDMLKPQIEARLD